MRWVDVCGPPGSGKSTICDSLWDPHAIAWDGHGIPEEWDALLAVVDELLSELSDHPTFRLLFGMTRRSLRKMASVYRRDDDAIYIQTGLAQRGLGFGWRLAERGRVHMVRRYFEAMPVSLGVAILSCPVDIAQHRNRARLNNPTTEHENREHMVPLMQPAIAVLKEVMNERRVPTLEVDTTADPRASRDGLLYFTARRASEAAAAGPDREVETVQVDNGPGRSQRLPVAHRTSA